MSNVGGVALVVAKTTTSTTTNKAPFSPFFKPLFVGPNGGGVCMKPGGSVAGSRLNLKARNDTDGQRFVFTVNSHIKLINNNELCLAFDASASKKSNVGTPLQLLRPLLLTSCEKTGARYTTWRMVALPAN